MGNGLERRQGGGCHGELGDGVARDGREVVVQHGKRLVLSQHDARAEQQREVALRGKRQSG